MHLMKVGSSAQSGETVLCVIYIEAVKALFTSSIPRIVQLQGPDAAINKLDANGCTPLMYAVMADSKLAIEMLLNFGAKREQVCVCVGGGGGRRYVSADSGCGGVRVCKSGWEDYVYQ